MTFKRAILTLLTFSLAIQFLHNSTPSPGGRLQLASTPTISAIVEPLEEQSTVDFYFKPPIGTAYWYAPGNCTWGVASWTGVPTGLGNATDWAYNASRMGYKVTQTPGIGAVAQKTGGLGHVALVINKTDTMVLTRDMNVRGLGSVGEYWHPYSYWSNYIYF